jgi:hypothetical protein
MKGSASVYETSIARILLSTTHQCLSINDELRDARCACSAGGHLAKPAVDITANPSTFAVAVSGLRGICRWCCRWLLWIWFRLVRWRCWHRIFWPERAACCLRWIPTWSLSAFRLLRGRVPGTCDMYCAGSQERSNRLNCGGRGNSCWSTTAVYVGEERSIGKELRQICQFDCNYISICGFQHSQHLDSLQTISSNSIC